MNIKISTSRKILWIFLLFLIGVAAFSYLYCPKVLQDLLNTKNLANTIGIICIMLFLAVLLQRTEKQLAHEIQKNNLIVLAFGDEFLYPSIMLISDQKTKELGLTISNEDGTWSAPSNYKPDQRETFKIGKGQIMPIPTRKGIIGVFNRLNIEHLQTMSEAIINHYGMR